MSPSAADRGVEPSIFEDNVGRKLRRSRESYDQDLRRVAEALRIRYVYLDAIEKGHHDRMPGAAYAVGFVRSYAEFLGLDTEEVVNQYKREIDGVDQDQNLHFPTPAPESKVPGGAVFLICGLIALLAYGTWYYLSSRENNVVDLIPELPDRLQALVADEAPADQGAEAVTSGATPQGEAEPAQAPADAAPSDATAAEPVPSDAETAPEIAPPPAAETQASGPDAVDPVPGIASPDQAPRLPVEAASLPDAPPAPEPSSVFAVLPDADATAPLADPAEDATRPGPSLGSLADSLGTATDSPAPGETIDEVAIPSTPAITAAQGLAALAPDQPASELFGAENSDAQVVLKATMDCWVQVRDAQGELLLTQVLRPGDRYMVPNQPGLVMMTGNAGGLEIIVDNVVLPPFGPVGAVRRDIVLEPRALIERAAGL